MKFFSRTIFPKIPKFLEISVRKKIFFSGNFGGIFRGFQGISGPNSTPINIDFMMIKRVNYPTKHCFQCLFIGVYRGVSPGGKKGGFSGFFRTPFFRKKSSRFFSGCFFELFFFRENRRYQSRF